MSMQPRPWSRAGGQTSRRVLLLL